MEIWAKKEGFSELVSRISVVATSVAPRLVFLTYAIAVRCEDVGVVNALAGSVMGCFLAKISWGKWGGCWLETQYRVYCWWFRHPAPVDGKYLSLFTGYSGIHRCQGAWGWDFFHQGYVRLGLYDPSRSSVVKWWTKTLMFTFYCHGLNIHPLDGSSVPSCSIFQKHRNFEPSHGAFCSLCRGVVKQKPLSYSIVHGFNFQLSDLNLWQLWEWMFFNTKPTETNPPAGMVCLVLPGLLFFYTCRMQCRAKVGGLQQSLLSKGRGVCQQCPGSGWVGLEGLDEMMKLVVDRWWNACFHLSCWLSLGQLSEIRHLSISLWKKEPYVYERSEPQKNCSWEAVSGHILHGGASARISRAMENNYISTNAAACAVGRLSDLCVWCDLHCGGYRTLAGWTVKELVDFGVRQFFKERCLMKFLHVWNEIFFLHFWGRYPTAPLELIPWPAGKFCSSF